MARWPDLPIHRARLAVLADGSHSRQLLLPEIPWISH